MVTDSGDASMRSGGRGKRKLNWKERVSLAVVFVMTLTMVLVFAGPVIDRHTVVTERCTVLSAEPRTGGGGARGAASLPRVRIETRECGLIGTGTRGTSLTVDELADSFVVGAVYEFDIGWYSRVVFRDLLGQIATAEDYRLVG